MTDRTAFTRRGRAAAALAAGIALLWAHGAGAADSEPGLVLAEKWCNSCHSIGTSEPRQEDAGPIWAEIADKHEGDLLQALNTPHDFMPDFPSLSDADKENLVSYIRSLE